MINTLVTIFLLAGSAAAQSPSPSPGSPSPSPSPGSPSPSPSPGSPSAQSSPAPFPDAGLGASTTTGGQAGSFGTWYKDDIVVCFVCGNACGARTTHHSVEYIPSKNRTTSATTAVTLPYPTLWQSTPTTGHPRVHGQARPSAAHALWSLATTVEAPMASPAPPRALVAAPWCRLQTLAQSAPSERARGGAAPPAPTSTSTCGLPPLLRYVERVLGG